MLWNSLSRKFSITYKDASSTLWSVLLMSFNCKIVVLCRSCLDILHMTIEIIDKSIVFIVINFLFHIKNLNRTWITFRCLVKNKLKENRCYLVVYFCLKFLPWWVWLFMVTNSHSILNVVPLKILLHHLYQKFFVLFLVELQQILVPSVWWVENWFLLNQLLYFFMYKNYGFLTVEKLKAFSMFIVMGEGSSIFYMLFRWLYVENLCAATISNPRYDYCGLLLIVSY